MLNYTNASILILNREDLLRSKQILPIEVINLTDFNKISREHILTHDIVIFKENDMMLCCILKQRYP